MYTLTAQTREKLRKYLRSKDMPGKYENKLWKKVEKYIPYFSLVSGVQCICICNSLAMNACHKDSDIDLFVITRKNRLWTARIGLTLLTSLLGVRKTSHKHAGKFCLSFFISEDEEHFSDIAIEDDIYLSYWLETLTPVVNKNNAFEKFLERNGLEENYTHNYLYPKSFLFQKEKGTANSFVASLSGFVFVGSKIINRAIKKIGDFNEHILKKIFHRKTLKSYERLGKPFGVIISDTMLKFHDKDKRKEIRDAVL